jgi:hypothetical protein
MNLLNRERKNDKTKTEVILQNKSGKAYKHRWYKILQYYIILGFKNAPKKHQTHHNFAKEINCNLCKFFSLFSKINSKRLFAQRTQNSDLKKFQSCISLTKFILLNFT